MLANNEIDLVKEEYARIMSFAVGQVNDETYAYMLSSWQSGDGMMPDNLGLNKTVFNCLLQTHYPGLNLDSLEQPGRVNDEQRHDERDEVYKLLVTHRANQSDSELWMATIVASACQGQNHLWQDMGLWSRNQLSELLTMNFPGLAAKNVKNMKWKKFLYKQLCQTEGIYTCRAPSCEVCVDYDVCFGPED